MSQPVPPAPPDEPGEPAGAAGQTAVTAPARRPDDPAAIRRRETDPLRVVPALDGARGYALVIVVLHHCWIAALNARLDEGLGRDLLASFFLGVNFFFVISGFVLFLPAARDGTFGSIRAYAARRAARILPAYYAALAGLILLFPAIAPPGAGNFFQRDHLESLAIHVVFLQRELLGDLHGLFGFGSTLGFGVNGPLWSLSIEALFYVCLPLVAMAFLRRPVLGLVLAFAVAVLWRVGTWNVLPDLLEDMDAVRRNNIVIGMAYQFPALIGNLALGMAAAWAYVRIMRSPEGSLLAALRRRAGLLQLPALALLLAAMAVTGSRDNQQLFADAWFRYMRDQVPAIAFALLILTASLGGRRAQLPWANGPARWLGDVSYGAYLWHGPVIWFALWQFGWYPHQAELTFEIWPFFRNVLFVLPVALFLGWASFRFIEQPVIRWTRERLRRGPARAARARPASGA